MTFILTRLGLQVEGLWDFMFRSNWKLEVLVFVDRGRKTREPGGKPSEQGQEPTTKLLVQTSNQGYCCPSDARNFLKSCSKFRKKVLEIS